MAARRAGATENLAGTGARWTDLRRRTLEQATSLTPIQLPGFVAQQTEEVYFAVPAKLAEWKKQRGHYEGGIGIRGASVRVPGKDFLGRRGKTHAVTW